MWVVLLSRWTNTRSAGTDSKWKPLIGQYYGVLTCPTALFGRDSMSQLVELPRYSSTAENAKQLQIGQIRSYVIQELQRQNELANQTKTRCEEEMKKVQASLEEVGDNRWRNNSGQWLDSSLSADYSTVIFRENKTL